MDKVNYVGLKSRLYDVFLAVSEVKKEAVVFTLEHEYRPMLKGLFDCDSSVEEDILELWIVDPSAERPAKKKLAKFNLSELGLDEVLPDGDVAEEEDDDKMDVEAPQEPNTDESSSDSDSDASMDESAASDESSHHAADDDFHAKSANQRIDECPDEFIAESDNRKFLLAPDRLNHCLILKEATFFFRKAEKS
jgi:hypothetical protein